MPRPFRFLPPLTGLLAAAMLMLAGCQRATEESPAPGGNSPTAAMRQLIDDLHHDDLVAFWKHGLPPADHAALVARWASGQAAQVPTDAARQGYRQWMGSLTPAPALARPSPSACNSKLTGSTVATVTRFPCSSLSAAPWPGGQW